MPDLRITVPVLKVVQALLAADRGARVYGLELSEQTGLKSGTLYPVLARLEQAGWVASAWENADPREIGRPRRRYYELSGLGQRSGRTALAEFASAPPAPDRLRPRPHNVARPVWGQT